MKFEITLHNPYHYKLTDTFTLWQEAVAHITRNTRTYCFIVNGQSFYTADDAIAHIHGLRR